MGVLDVFLLITVKVVPQIFLSEIVGDILCGSCFCFCRDTDGVGSQIGDETRGTALSDVDTFIQLLGNHHGLLGIEVQLVGCLLLQAAGGEGCVGLLQSGLVHDVRDLILPCCKLLQDRIIGFLIRYIQFASLPGHQFGSKLLSLHELCGYDPVLLGIEPEDLLLPVAYDLQCGGLYSSCGQSRLDLSPEKRTDLISHQTVQDSSGLLCIHQILIDLAGMLDGLLDLGLGDLVKFDTAVLIRLNPQNVRQVPGYGFSLAVRVSCQVYFRSLLGFLLQFLDQISLTPDIDVFRLEVIFYVDPQFTFRKVSHMTY